MLITISKQLPTGVSVSRADLDNDILTFTIDMNEVASLTAWEGMLLAFGLDIKKLRGY